MTEWYKKSFGQDYLLVYKHRDFAGAYREVCAMANWLQLPGGAKVFDLCCGMGRHSLALSHLGYAVTGMDLSEVLLGEAKRLDKEGRVRWVHGDMRTVPLDEKFDAVVNLFTSFGYFEHDADNERVLREMERLLKPDGRFLIDFLNPVFVSDKLVPCSERRENGTGIQEYRKIENGCVKKEIVLRGGTDGERRYSEQVKLYDLDDFTRLLSSTDMKIDQVFGDYDGALYDDRTSPRLIMVGSRKQDQQG